MMRWTTRSLLVLTSEMPVPPTVLSLTSLKPESTENQDLASGAGFFQGDLSLRNIQPLEYILWSFIKSLEIFVKTAIQLNPKTRRKLGKQTGRGQKNRH